MLVNYCPLHMYKKDVLIKVILLKFLVRQGFKLRGDDQKKKKLLLHLHSYYDPIMATFLKKQQQLTNTVVIKFKMLYGNQN